MNVDLMSQVLEQMSADMNEDLMDRVLAQIVKDVADGDFTAIEELLMTASQEALKGFLCED